MLHSKPIINFSQMILMMQDFWAKQGCAILQGIDTEVGAATYHTATIFGIFNSDQYNVQFVQPCKRPQDGRAGKHPNRLFTHHQFQVIMQPVPTNIQSLVLDCFSMLGLKTPDYDIRFVEDDWKNPTIGAAGLGWEVRCNEMEVLQYTYFQQIAGITLKNIPVELAYGLERLAMRVQNKTSIYDLMWSDTQTYLEVRLQQEKEDTISLQHTNPTILITLFEQFEALYKTYIEANLALSAYVQCTKMSHTFNMLDAIGLGNSQREEYIAKIRKYTKNALMAHIQNK